MALPLLDIYVLDIYSCSSLCDEYDLIQSLLRKLGIDIGWGSIFSQVDPFSLIDIYSSRIFRDVSVIYAIACDAFLSSFLAVFLIVREYLAVDYLLCS